MKKLIVALLAMTVGMSSAIAGSVDGKLTKIRTYEEGRIMVFKSKIPNLAYKMKKSDVVKAMLKRGQTKIIGTIEKNGILIDSDKKTFLTLDRVGDGLYIKSRIHTMFVTEKELENVR